MKIEYLMVADAVNFGPDGKVNMLGMGWRQVNMAQLPSPFSFSIVASVTVPPAEAGAYEGEYSLTLPDGTEEVLSRTPVVFAQPPEETVLLGMVLGLEVVARPLTQAGLYTVRLKVGVASAEYQFRVNTPAAPASQEPASGVPASRRRRPVAAAR